MSGQDDNRRRFRDYRPRSRAGKVLAKLLTALFYSAIMALVGGWALMIAVGVVHAHWLTTMPTIGYWPAVVVVFLLSWVVSALRPSEYSRKRLMGDDAVVTPGQNSIPMAATRRVGP